MDNVCFVLCFGGCSGIAMSQSNEKRTHIYVRIGMFLRNLKNLCCNIVVNVVKK